jgi:hypothetical protein
LSQKMLFKPVEQLCFRSSRQSESPRKEFWTRLHPSLQSISFCCPEIWEKFGSQSGVRQNSRGYVKCQILLMLFSFRGTQIPKGWEPSV